LKKIEDYLNGKLSREDAWRWAVDVMHKTKDGELDKDVYDALLSIYGLHDDEERFRTAKEDLIKIKKELQEKIEEKQKENPPS